MDEPAKGSAIGNPPMNPPKGISIVEWFWRCWGWWGGMMDWWWWCMGAAAIIRKGSCIMEFIIESIWCISWLVLLQKTQERKKGSQGYCIHGFYVRKNTILCPLGGHFCEGHEMCVSFTGNILDATTRKEPPARGNHEAMGICNQESRMGK